MSYYNSHKRLGIYLNTDHMTRIYWQAEVQRRTKVFKAFQRDKNWLESKLGVKKLEEMGYFDRDEYWA